MKQREQTREMKQRKQMNKIKQMKQIKQLKQKSAKLGALLLAASLLFPLAAEPAFAEGQAAAIKEGSANAEQANAEQANVAAANAETETDEVAADETVIRLYTAEDWEAFAKNCSLDTWSQGKTVYLEADIDFSGKEYCPVPTFGGAFEGQNHTISGMKITGSGEVRGLFRYIQPSGRVSDLIVKGFIDPEEKQNSIGGIAGNNSGVLNHCTFIGTLSGRDSIGGIAGVNDAKGQIVNCVFSGGITGEHSVGGIAGQNFGTVLQCTNKGSINATEVEAKLDMDELNRDQLNAAENVPVCTDIGGIAGFSGGVLQGCVNEGAVGYAHVGYNIGGIAGRQSGYLDGCRNEGSVQGRKDVGGICGQLEPEIRLVYREGELSVLMDALSKLQTMVDKTGDNLRASSDSLSVHMDAISERAEDAGEAVENLADAGTSWADENIEQINVFSARLSWLCDALMPVVDDADGMIGTAERFGDRLEEALTEAMNAGKIGAETEENVKQMTEELRSAAEQAKNARERVRAAIEHLKEALGRKEETGEAAKELFAALQALSDAGKALTEAVNRGLELLWAAEGTEEALSEVRDEINDASLEIEAGFDELSDSLPAMGEALWKLGSIIDDPEALHAAIEDVRTAGEALANAAKDLSEAVGKGKTAAGKLKEFLLEAKDAGEDLKESGNILEHLTDRLYEVGNHFYDVFFELSGMPVIQFQPIDAALKGEKEALSDVLSGLLDDGKLVQETMHSAAGTLLDDLEAINGQFGVITDVLGDIMEPDEEEVNRFEDVSDEETEIPKTGAIVNSENKGTVEGDVNTAGIAGSMAIEYDFDPEDDLIQEGDRSMDFRYQTRSAVASCINNGTVLGKEDYAGGIAGLMDIGRISGCENYGGIESKNGDYVGGIAGASWGSIRDSWSKGSLSGRNYVGGIAGRGAVLINNHSLPAIEDGEACLGMIAGAMDQDGSLAENTFTGEGLGAIDGISYAGKAEPVSFEALCATAGAPEGFSEMKLRFVADGILIEEVPFRYGEGMGALPQIPEKEGYYAAWEELDYSRLVASKTVEAVYTPYLSVLSDNEKVPLLLAEGSFGKDAGFAHSSEDISFTDAGGAERSVTAYTITVTDPKGSTDPYTVHYRLPEAKKNWTLWVRGENGTFEERDYRLSGNYMLFDAENASVTFCVTEDNSKIIGIVAAGGVVLLLLAGAGIHLTRKRRKRGTKEQKQ